MLQSRPMKQDDMTACVAILNATIAIGGTTAHETPFTVQEFSDHYFQEPPVRTVVMSGPRLVGFQSAFEVGNGDLSIGSFTDQVDPVKGAGRVMFAQTLAEAKRLGFARILAKITADNAPGLGYYSAMGFRDLEVIPSDAMRNGQPVDRIVKAYDLRDAG